MYIGKRKKKTTKIIPGANTPINSKKEKGKSDYRHRKIDSFPSLLSLPEVIGAKASMIAAMV